MKQAFKSLLLSFAAMLFVVSAAAQVTTSELNGKVSDRQGEGVPGATVVAVHTPSGTQYYAVANAEGRFSIRGMRTGGPYSVEISCLGYNTVTYTDITLKLGEAYALYASMSEDTEMLKEAIVISEAATKFASEKTGVATNINNAQITSLPTVSRSITDVTKLSPYGGNGMSFAGSDGRTSNFTVDGANFNNNFGLSDGLPGGGSPISIDAIEEVQVVISPYDVRQANFIGGGVNAITKSGTNTFKGSAYIYHRNENMRGDVVDGEAVSGARDKDRTTTYGFTLGGPIVKNKLFFFANFEKSMMPTVVNRWHASEDGAANPDKYVSRTTLKDMETVSNFLKKEYGYDTGSWTDFPANEDNMKILARIDWNISDKHKLALRYNYTVNNRWNSTNGSSSDTGQRTTKNRLSEYSMSFANSMYSMQNVVHTWSLDLNSRLTDVLSNQFLATYSMLDDVRGTNSEPFPFIDILDGTGTITPYMSVGYELFTWKNAVHNRVLTIKDDVAYFAGDHKITGGLSYEYQLADNAYMRNGSGYYRYNSLQDFLNGATPETVNLTYGYDGNENPAATVRFHKIALYGQDEWNPTDRLVLTAGLRIESIIFNNADVARNQAIYDVDYNGYHIDTGTWPTTKIQFSPRIGFVWDVLGDKSLKVRGGTGLFTGRLPLVFFTNMPTNSGVVQYQGKITTTYKNGVATPSPYLAAFAGDMITDPAALRDKMISVAGFPTTYDPAKGTKPSSISAVDPKFKMPQVWKTSLAIDYAFPTSFPLSITGEVIFNKTVNAVCIRDYNMKPVEGFARLNGADNRHMYPTDYTYTYNYAKSSTGTSAYLLTNTNQGYGGSASVQINARPVDGLSFTAAYTHTVSKELTGMPGSDASSAFTYVPTSEGPNNAPLHNSQYVTPDRAFASLTYDDPANNHFSLYYETWRGGSNYTYMYANDLNNDNYNYDVMYIPRDASEIRFASPADAAAYWAFAEKDPYLTANAGKYAEAYSVYSPWVHRLDFSYKHDFVIKIGSVRNTLQLSVDIKNILNLFNSSWGVAKYMNPSLNSGRILNVDRIDSDGVPVFSTIKDSKGNQILSDTIPTWTYSHAIGQCWYAQIGLKYMFN
ncbi:MAG: TonB-dependent receptor [Bacteroidales bacterium]|nr:TonB-dependent receptor [Bacteroidales bacterium]